MRDESVVRRFVGWRWSPCVALSSASILFVLTAWLVIPDSFGRSEARESSQSSAPLFALGARSTPAAHAAAVGRALPVAAAALVAAPAPAAAAPAPADHAVSSLFPSAPAAELPPPLEDDPPPPEPPAPSP